MTEMTGYEHGVPSWVDMGSHDIPGALAFYGALFGWEGDDQGEQMGHYTLLRKDGKLVAGIGAASDPGPPRWTTYVNVDSSDDVVKRAEAAGAMVLMPPMDVGEAGRMAVLADPTGAAFAVWQPDQHRGAELVNEPGSLIWNELSTSDLDGAKRFYSEVFGWEWGGSPTYAEMQVGGRTVGGVMPRPEQLPAEVPDYWLVYFATADVDADTHKAVELGATLQAGPIDVPDTGRFTVLTDPQGAGFALFQGN